MSARKVRFGSEGVGLVILLVDSRACEMFIGIDFSGVGGVGGASVAYRAELDDNVVNLPMGSVSTKRLKSSSRRRRTRCWSVRFSCSVKKSALLLPNG